MRADGDSRCLPAWRFLSDWRLLPAAALTIEKRLELGSRLQLRQHRRDHACSAPSRRRKLKSKWEPKPVRPGTFPRFRSLSCTPAGLPRRTNLVEFPQVLSIASEVLSLFGRHKVQPTALYSLHRSIAKAHRHVNSKTQVRPVFFCLLPCLLGALPPGLRRFGPIA